MTVGDLVRKLLPLMDEHADDSITYPGYHRCHEHVEVTDIEVVGNVVHIT